MYASGHEQVADRSSMNLLVTGEVEFIGAKHASSGGGLKRENFVTS